MGGICQYSKRRIKRLLKTKKYNPSGFDSQRMEELGRFCYPNLFQACVEYQKIEELLLSNHEFRAGWLASAWKDKTLSAKAGIIQFSIWLLNEAGGNGTSADSFIHKSERSYSLFRFWQSSIREYEIPHISDSIEVLNSLAVSAPNEYVGLLGKMTSWTLKTRFLVQPLIRAFSRNQRNDLNERIIPRIIAATNLIDNTETEKGLAVLSIVFGVVAWMYERVVAKSQSDCTFGLSLVQSIIAKSFCPSMIRVTILACLLSEIHGEINNIQVEQISDSKSLYIWLFNAMLSDQKRELLRIDDICRYFGCPPIQRNPEAITTFIESGEVKNNLFDYSMVYIIARHLELKLDEEYWRRMSLGCFLSPSGPFYWHSRNTLFSTLTDHLTATILEQVNPISYIRSIRDGIDSMLYRMRTTRKSEQFVWACQVSEMYLSALVVLIDAFVRQNKYSEALDLFKLGWKDCVVGLYIGEFGRWPRVSEFVCYFFFYKVAKLDPHFNRWQNLELLNKLPIRGRDSDTLTCQELCIDCLLRNESAVPWDDIGKNDPGLANAILSYNNLDEVAKHPVQIHNALGHSKDANLAGVEAKHEVFTQPDNFKAMHRQ